VALGFGPIYDALVAIRTTPAQSSVFPFINALQKAAPSGVLPDIDAPTPSGAPQRARPTSSIGGNTSAPTSACTQSWQTTPGVCTGSHVGPLSPGDYTLEVFEWTNTADDPSHPPIGDTCFDVTVTGP
jgi:hypothetical protein